MKIIGTPPVEPGFIPRSLTITFQNQREMDVFASLFRQPEMAFLEMFGISSDAILEQMKYIGANSLVNYEQVRTELRTKF